MTQQRDAGAVEALIGEVWERLMDLVGPKLTMAEVRAPAVRATRQLEQFLVDALDARKLKIRNLPNLVPDDRGFEVRAIRVRGRAESWFDLFHPQYRGGASQTALVLRDDGKLYLVTVGRSGSTDWRLAEDGDLQAEDLLGFIRAIAFAMDRNRKADELGALATRVTEVLTSLRAD
jgi:hypothetical protein